MTDDPAGPELAAELEHLRARLAETEEVLRAIRDGHVDGVLVTGDRGEQVYTLRGVDRIYRQLIETMSEGAATLSDGGVIRYCNGRLAEMLGQPLDRVVGTALRNHLPPADQQALDAILAQARTGSNRREINLKTSEGRLVPVYLSASRLPDEEAEMVFCLVLTDLTEQKSYEQIATAERLARSILEQAAEAIVVCDEQGRVMRASQAAERLCDGSPLQRPFAEVFPLRTDASDAFLLAPVLQGETLRNVDVTLDRHGQRFDFILAAGPLVSDQQVLGCVVTLTDITERRRARDELREKEYVLSESQRLGHVGSWFWEMAGPIAWSDEMYRIYGVSPDTFIPTAESLVGLIHPDDRPAMQSWMAACAAGEQPTELEFRISFPDGTTRHLLGRGEGVLGVGNRPGYIAGTAQDITHSKRAEAQRERLAALVEASPDFIGFADSKTLLIQYINKYGRRMCGIGEDEDIGNVRISDAHPAWMNQRMAEVILPAAIRDGLWEGEGAFLHRNGREIPVSMALMAHKGANGEVDFFYTVSRDITETKRLEALFLQSQKMETVGQLAGGIAHDFNNLLTVINGISEVILAEVGEDAPVHADVQEILHAGQRAAALTRQLLAFSRQQVLEPRVLNLKTVVAGIESLLRRLLGEDIDLVVVPTPGVGDVKADPGQIEQVLTNLAVNARDAMPRGGRLTIETQNVTIDEDYALEHGGDVLSGTYVLLSVSDSGVGMDEATRARIFEPFFTTKGPGKGTGLGLSTIYGIVKQSHGFIWVYSEVGQGTSFKIYLPRVAEAASTVQPEPPTVVSSSGTETILVVEDNAGLRKLATRLLEPAGYTVLEAASGEDALRVLEHHGEPVHLLLSDVVLPGMSGRELAEQLVQTHQGMKVLYMSGYTSDTIVRHGVLEATVSFLNKPFTAAALLRKVREVLDSQG